MKVIFKQGTNYSSAPSWLTGPGGILAQVAAFYDHMFSNNITISVTINWVPLAWTMTTSGESGVLADNNIDSPTSGVVKSYSTLTSALNAHATNTIQSEAYGNMPTSGVSSVYVAPGEAMILGLKTTATVNIHLDVNSVANWSGAGGFNPLDAYAAIAHEISETAMGRISNPGGSQVDVMDLFRFSGSGHHDLTTGATSTSILNSSAYFSIDNGATNLGWWENDPNKGDFGDWIHGRGPLPDDAFGTTGGGVAPVSEVDIALMNVLGWGVTAVTSGVWSKVSAGQTFDGYTVMSGGLMTVLSGGTATNTIYTDAQQFNDGVLDSGSSGGAGGNGFIDGTEVSATVGAGGAEWVLSGGYASATTVSAWGLVLDFADVDSAIISANGMMDVELSGTSYSASIKSGGLVSVHSGGVSDHTSVFSGGVMSIGAGGSGSVDRILNGGQEYVYGVTGLDVISSGGSQTIEAGGSAALDAVSAGGTQIILAGGESDVTFVYGTQQVFGVASGDFVSGGPANQYVQSGGLAVNTTLTTTGYQIVSSGGVANGTTVSSSTRQIIQSGGHASATIVDSGGDIEVLSGAFASSITVSAGGTLNGGGVLILNNVVAGSAINVTVGDAGNIDTLDLLSGGVARDVTVVSGSDSLTVEYGAYASGTVLSAGGADYVLGTTMSTTVSSGGVEYTSSGGFASSTTILSGGAAFVLSGATTIDTMISGGEEYVSSGGEAISATVLNGGALDVESGAVAYGLMISSGGVLSGAGYLIDANSAAGLVSGITVGDPAYSDSLEMLSGGLAEGVTVTNNGNSLAVDSGASASGTVIESGAQVTVLGTTTGTVIGSGGEYVLAGGEAIGAVVQSGGLESLATGAIGDSLTVSSGGLLSGAGVISHTNTIAGDADQVSVGNGASMLVKSGGVAFGTTVLAGGKAIVSSGGVINSEVVSSGGKEIVSSAGVTHGTTLQNGGLAYIYTGGAASGTTVLAGGRDYVSSGGSTLSTTLSSGGTGYVMSSGATAVTLVSSGGKEIISKGGFASGTRVLSGGLETVYAGGVASGGKIIGDAYVSAGGSEINATVSSGGLEVVYQSGLANGINVLYGGRANIASGGVAVSASVAFAGTLVVSAGGTLSGLYLNSGGLLVDNGSVLFSGARSLYGTLSGSGILAETGTGDLMLSGAGAKFTGQAVISGGTIELATAGALGKGAVVFTEPVTGSATLQIDAADAPAAGGTFANVISNFSGANDYIDLRSIAFVSGATATVSGSTLVLSEGGNTYKFKLAGSIGGSMPVTNDGHGGTLIDPKAVAFAQAAAGFTGPSGGSLTPVSGSASSSQTLFAVTTASAGAAHG